MILEKLQAVNTVGSKILPLELSLKYIQRGVKSIYLANISNFPTALSSGESKFYIAVAVGSQSIALYNAAGRRGVKFVSGGSCQYGRETQNVHKGTIRLKTVYGETLLLKACQAIHDDTSQFFLLPVA